MLPLEILFWSKVDIKGPDDCWEWQASVTQTGGYGQFNAARHLGHSRMAHRWAWILTQGSIPKGLYVLHHCDNRPCCNPKHLYLGTYKDNARDMVERGRLYIRTGADNHQTKLTPEQVIMIRKDPRPQRTIAKEYGVSQPAIRQVKLRLTHKGIP